MHVHAVLVHGAILQRADQLEAGAVSDVSKSRVGMRSEGPLVDAALPGAVEDGSPSLELQHPVRRLLRVDLGHLPVVDELAALHRVGEMHLPRVLVGDVVHGRRHATFGHDRVGFAQ